MSYQDSDAKVFNEAWPGGYVETFEGYLNCYPSSKYGKKDIIDVLRFFYNSKHTALEIGPGGGMWTKECLIPHFKHVTAVDVVPAKFSANCTYIQAPSKDFTCYGVADNSIDFLFSFGCFCHLSEDAQACYLKAAFTKMKSRSKGLVMFANFDRHPYYAEAKEEEKKKYEQNISPGAAVWFYMDLNRTKQLIKDAGFINFTDTLPDFRDTLASFVKP